jgi:Zn-dependent protease with chaperone function
LSIGYSKIDTPWYDYEGSHWLKRKEPDAKGIDFAHEPKYVYALHLLVGHHGLFSLTPVFLFSLVGMLCWRFQKPVDTGGGVRDCPDFRVMTLLVSAVVIGFYIWKTNNYGGWTSGPRWLFWLTPLLLLSMLPAADWLSRASWRRGLGYILLAASAFSAAYPVWNPWRHPWIYQMCEYYDWIRY